MLPSTGLRELKLKCRVVEWCWRSGFAQLADHTNEVLRDSVVGIGIQRSSKEKAIQGTDPGKHDIGPV
jgi:hypothetical protein